MLGFEILLIMLPLTDAKNSEKFKMFTLSNLVLTLFYCYVAIINFMFYSPEELKIVPQPMIYILKSFSFEIIERTDLIFVSIWVVTVFTSFVNYYFMAVVTGKNLIKSVKIKKKLPLMITILIMTVNLFINESDSYLVDKISMYITASSFVFIIGIPVMLLFVALARNFLGMRKTNEESR
ncbi:hypothetical protein D3H55_09130 [Bacillus salacetis]|uniref:Uncharacterized protein n=1 Tax=Bacillus salacetis TaxID=2315464 RepID=A0A3A1R153_9BACI|nr:GerAB/ArcD/ProY family transporter [Bacillus salacetis]RIW34667.1 hypothetical protein D3H55_09130 [Bacillus salacetis]